MTLRRRVMVALVALVALFTLIQGGLAVLSMHAQEDELVDDLVLAETRRLAARIEQGGVALLADEAHAPLPEGYKAWWQGPGGRTVPGPLPSTMQALADGPHQDDAHGHDHHIMVVPAAAGRLFVRYDAARNEEKVRAFALQVYLLAAFFIAMAALIAHHVAGLLIAPLEKVARLLDHWAPASEPGAVAAVDEERRVFDAFQRVQDRWEQGLARESERFADMHHEIRTPLAALRTDLEMLQDGMKQQAASGAGLGPRLQRSLAAVDAIAGALASMRELQTGQGAAAEPVLLRHCVDDAWVSLGELPAEHGLALSNEVAAQELATVNRQALMAILRNLIRNAAEHAAPGSLRVRYLEGQMQVADDGPGIPAEEMPFVFERYYRGRLADAPAPQPQAGPANDYARGLGLAIARQVAQANGWRLRVEAAQPRGTQFVISFQEPAAI